MAKDSRRSGDNDAALVPPAGRRGAASVPGPADGPRTPAELARARFEADRAVRATPWVLPDLDPKTAASEPHPVATGATNRQ